MSRVDFSKIAIRYEDYSLVQKSAGDMLLNLLEIGDSEDIFDLGCGVGNLTKKIREITTPFNPPLLRGNGGVVIGIDSSGNERGSKLCLSKIKEMHLNGSVMVLYHISCSSKEIFHIPALP